MNNKRIIKSYNHNTSQNLVKIFIYFEFFFQKFIICGEERGRRNEVV